MSELFKNKYRISSARLKSWDYSNGGFYFITIWTKNKRFYFGNIINDKMRLSTLGNIAQEEWKKTVDIRHDMNLQLGEFVIMPNHMHGIIAIGENEYNMSNRDTTHRVSTTQFGAQTKNLASIIRGYKSSVTIYARKNNIKFDWQPGYHEHIIRSIEGYNNISEYIMLNTSRWESDRLYCKVDPI